MLPISLKSVSTLPTAVTVAAGESMQASSSSLSRHPSRSTSRTGSRLGFANGASSRSPSRLIVVGSAPSRASDLQSYGDSAGGSDQLEPAEIQSGSIQAASHRSASGDHTRPGGSASVLVSISVGRGRPDSWPGPGSTVDLDASRSLQPEADSKVAAAVREMLAADPESVEHRDGGSDWQSPRRFQVPARTLALSPNSRPYSPASLESFKLRTLDSETAASASLPVSRELLARTNSEAVLSVSPGGPASIRRLVGLRQLHGTSTSNFSTRSSTRSLLPTGSIGGLSFPSSYRNGSESVELENPKLPVNHITGSESGDLDRNLSRATIATGSDSGRSSSNSSRLPPLRHGFPSLPNLTSNPSRNLNLPSPTLSTTTVPVPEPGLVANAPAGVPVLLTGTSLFNQSPEGGQPASDSESDVNMTGTVDGYQSLTVPDSEELAALPGTGTSSVTATGSVSHGGSKESFENPVVIAELVNDGPNNLNVDATATTESDTASAPTSFGVALAVAGTASGVGASGPTTVTGLPTEKVDIGSSTNLKIEFANRSPLGVRVGELEGVGGSALHKLARELAESTATPQELAEIVTALVSPEMSRWASILLLLVVEALAGLLQLLLLLASVSAARGECSGQLYPEDCSSGKSEWLEGPGAGVL